MQYVLHQTPDDHACGGATLAHLAVENTSGFLGKSTQFIYQQIEVTFMWSLFINNGESHLSQLEAFLVQLILDVAQGLDGMLALQRHYIFNILPVLGVLGLRVLEVSRFALVRFARGCSRIQLLHELCLELLQFVPV